MLAYGGFLRAVVYLLKDAVQQGAENIDIVLRKEGNKFRMAIRDDGLGIKEPDKMFLFIPLFTTDEAYITSLLWYRFRAALKAIGGDVWVNAALSGDDMYISEFIKEIPELAEFGKKNVSRYSFLEKGIAEIICCDGERGYKKEAPFDKILCSAAVQEKLPRAWKKQLKVGGRIVTPIKSSIWLLVKKSEKEFEETEFPGFAFVPLV